jgi:hypothetical protein
VDPFGLYPDAMTIQQVLTTIAFAGISTPELVTTAAGFILLGVILIDDASGGKVLQGISDFIGAMISPSVPVRDKEGNPIPLDQQRPSPTGKGANAGAETISSPGDLGSSGFKVPEPKNPLDKVALATFVGAATITGIYENRTGASSLPPPSLSQDSPSTNRPPVPWSEPSFSSISPLNQSVSLEPNPNTALSSNDSIKQK